MLNVCKAPIAILAIPPDCFADSLFKTDFWLPAQFSVYLGRIDRIPQIMTFPILHKCDKAFRFSEFSTYKADKINILHLVMSSHIVDLAILSPVNDQIDRPAVICHIKPVSHIDSLPIYRERLILQRIKDHPRDELLRKLKWAIIVGTSGNRCLQSISPAVCLHEQICRGL